MRSDFAGIIFDNDGTLVDSEAALVRAWTDWAIEFDVSGADATDLYGHSSAEIVHACVPPERAEEALQRILDLEVNEVSDVVAQPGAREALAALAGARVAVATSGVREVATARLRAAGLQAPDVFVTADDITRAKPDPEIFAVACERLGVAPEDCLVVEDSVAGVAAGKAAGCVVLAVCTTTPREKLSDADAIVATLAEVQWRVADGRVGVLMPEG